MTGSQVRLALRDYKTSKSVVIYLENKSAKLEKRIAEMKGDLAELRAHPISRAGYSKGSTADPTGDSAASIADESGKTLTYLNRELDIIKPRLEKARANVNDVEDWLMSLDEEERFVIEAYYFNKYSIVAVTERYNEKYGSSKTYNRVKYCIESVVDKISYLSETTE